MAERENKKKRRDGVRGSLMQRRAARRAERRMHAEAESEDSSWGLRQRLGWTLREAGWSLQERLLWPLADWLRGGFDAALWPLEHAAWALRKRVLWPLQDLLTGPATSRGKVPRAATAGVIGALALGSLGAGAFIASGQDDALSDEAAPAAVAQATEPDPEPEAITPILARTEPKPDEPVLKGVRPSFGASTDEEREAAKAALRKLKAEEAESRQDEGEVETEERTGSSKRASQSEPAGDQESTGEAAGDTPDGQPSDSGPETTDPVTGATASKADAENERRQESALNVAERFAVAFVSYEIGATGGPIKQVFRDTAQKELFDSLRQRPPRQPAGNKVPKARVMNVVGGPRKKKAMEVSVALLRVDGVSELRLEMEKVDRGWVVKTVRG